MDNCFLAVDLGASSGRVVLGRVNESVHLETLHRFSTKPVKRSGKLHTDIGALMKNVADGIAKAPIVSAIAVDSWSSDYGLVKNGELVGDPFYYRDDRTEQSMPRVDTIVNRQEQYRLTGIQRQPFNTVFQLASEDPATLTEADRVLLLPDLIGYLMTGELYTEQTMASTTGLYSADSKSWVPQLIDAATARVNQFAPVVEPGHIVGVTTPSTSKRWSLPTDLRVAAVASHDTASAFVGAPIVDETSVVISSGTWSLVGAELDLPIISESARESGFTNEIGADGTYRFLKNITGLWLLSESARGWDGSDLSKLIRRTEDPSIDFEIFDVNDPVFYRPGDDMSQRIVRYMEQHCPTAPSSPLGITKSVIKSLAVAYRATINDLSALTGRKFTKIHVVGGGSLNEVLCQATADTCGLPVVAGPSEATSLGNVLIQARATGLLQGELPDLRRHVSRSTSLSTYVPRATS